MATKEYSQKWNSENKDKVSIKSKKWRDKNKENIESLGRAIEYLKDHSEVA